MNSYQSYLERLNSPFDCKNAILALQCKVSEEDSKSIPPIVGKLVLVTSTSKEDDLLTVCLLTDLSKNEQFKMSDSERVLMENRYKDCRHTCEKAMELASEVLSILISGVRKQEDIHKIVFEYDAIKTEYRNHIA